MDLEEGLYCSGDWWRRSGEMDDTTVSGRVCPNVGETVDRDEGVAYHRDKYTSPLWDGGGNEHLERRKPAAACGRQRRVQTDWCLLQPQQSGFAGPGKSVITGIET